ncbi:MAG: cation diffusion facilitator family transporter [Eubacteriales bacterium]|nr:cation diffusion facilitator family transporter [Eubacteriales bacterium]
MIALLSGLFIKNASDYQNPAVRKAYGTLCGIVGIALNILLFLGKWISGILSGSIAITADAFNNLSDAGSSVITLIGFQMSGQKPDKEHPYGHGRMEYLSAMFVSIAILFMGLELGRTSVDKILHPEKISSSPLIFGILIVSVLVKFYMFLYNRQTGKKIDSASMRATANDSLSDMIATSIVLIATVISTFTGILLDGWLGILVSIFIFYTGFSTLRETVTLLLGQPPKKEFVDEIEHLVLASPAVRGIHDLLVHDYGPGRCMISLHAEVSAKADLLKIHDEIDNIERELEDQLHCIATIHMDPVITDDAETTKMYHTVCELVKAILPDITIHDFRMVEGETHTNLIFDVVIPYNTKYTDDEIVTMLRKIIAAMPDKKYFSVINVDHAYY